MLATIRTIVCTSLAVVALAPAPGALAMPIRDLGSSASEPVSSVSAPPIEPVESGFDWVDAGIGAGGALAIVGVMASSAALVRRRDERSRAA